MALSDILQKISDEAGKKAAFMKQVADDEIAKIKSEASERANLKRAEISEKALEKAQSVKEKAELLAKMEGRNRLLSEKRAVIDEVYTESSKELAELKGTGLQKLFVSMLKSAAESMPKAHVVVAPDHKSAVKEAIEKAGVEYHIKDEDSGLKGGFVLSDGKQEINLSFKYLLSKVVRPKTELEVAKILFE